VLEGVGEIAEGTDAIRVLRPDHPLLDFLGVRFLLAEPEAEFGGKWRLVYRGRDGALFENAAARPRFFAEGAAVEVRQTSTADFVLRVAAARPVRVVSSEPAGPGWEVRVDGRRTAARLVREAFVGCDVPSGVHRVTVKYRPSAFYGSLAASVAGVLLLLLMRFPKRVE
jgi:hypothetical protein